MKEMLQLAKPRSLIEEMAKESSSFILKHFRDSSLQAEIKSDSSPVTEADRGAEALIRKLIAGTFPEHGIIGEEYGREREGHDWVWVLDPIDGTIAFTHGCPLFGTLVALMYQGEPVLGMINHPALSLCLIGDGSRTSLNGRPVRVRRAASLSQATLLMSDLNYTEGNSNTEKMRELRAGVKYFRTWGDCYGYSMVASGYADIMLDRMMHLWDVAALVPVLKGAGASICAWDGSPAHLGETCVATHPDLMDEVRSYLKL